VGRRGRCEEPAHIVREPGLRIGIGKAREELQPFFQCFRQRAPLLQAPLNQLLEQAFRAVEQACQQVVPTELVQGQTARALVQALFDRW